MTNSAGRDFLDVVDRIGGIGRQRHADQILEHARQNRTHAIKSLTALPKPSGAKAESALVISAGPSVHRRQSIPRIRDAGYAGTIVAVDGAYVACLRHQLIPDYVVTLDPHRGRVVRWFGDHELEENTRHDDYFERQDLDVEFRKNAVEQNQQNIALVNRYGHRTRALVATTAPLNVVRRIHEAQFDAYWWNPLVDDPTSPDSLTRQLYQINKLPCINTGGNVGGAAFVIASTTLGIPSIGLVGMDFGYYSDTPLEMTQTYHELVHHAGSSEGLDRLFCDFTFPGTGERFFTDPTYYWYRRNFLQLLEQSAAVAVNCTEGGTLIDPRVPCVSLDSFLSRNVGPQPTWEVSAHG